MGRAGRRRAGGRRPPGRAAEAWAALPAARARQVPLPDRAPHPGARRASSRSSRRWTAASRSRSRATSTSRSPPRTSSTTPAGPTSSTTPSPAATVEPLGVAGQIIPWNFPLLMAAWKIAPALACGNTVVLKPAETTPLTALLLAEICQEAELPPGVVNIVTGDGDDRRGARATTRASTRSPSPARPRSARSSRRALAGTRQAADARARRQGGEHRVRGRRRSTRPSRASSTASTSTRATSAARARGCSSRRSRCRRGDRQAVGSGCGRCASAIRSTRTPTSARSTRPSSSRRSRRWSRPARTEGAIRHRSPARCPSAGYWFAPTLFTDVAPAHRIAREEIFGPVLSVLTFRTPAEAVEKANNTPYGLAAGVWTDKGVEGFEVASALRAGVVWANTYNHFDPTAPFGGYKESRLRPRGRPRRAAPVSPCDAVEPRLGSPSARPTSSSSAARSCAPSRAATTRPAGHNFPRGLAQGRPRRGRRRTARRQGPGRRDGLQPRPDPVPRRRDARVARAASRARDGGARPRRGRARAAIDLLVHYAGWTDKLQPGARRDQPGRGAVPSFTAARADRRRRDRRARRAAAARARAELAPALAAGNVASSRSCPRPTPLPGLDLAEALGVSDVPPAS